MKDDPEDGGGWVMSVEANEKSKPVLELLGDEISIEASIIG
jgi:hypothetical protein